MYTATAVAFLAAASGALAQTASVVNKCSFPIYVQPNGGNAVQLAAGTGVYTEQFRPSAAIYIANSPQSLGAPLTLEYNAWDNNGTPTMSYDLSNNAGNPLADQHNTLYTANAACAGVDCAANDANCYSNGGSIKVLGCTPPSDLTATICA